MTHAPSPQLPGTAAAGTWRITTADMDDADARIATFASIACEPQALGRPFQFNHSGKQFRTVAPLF